MVPPKASDGAQLDRASRTIAPNGSAVLRSLTVHFGTPLLLGAATYALWRPRSLGSTGWAFSTQVRPPAWCLDHASDAAWAYATAAFVSIVWRDGTPGRRRAWLAIAAAMVACAELGQRWHLVPGRYDPIDLLVMTVAFSLALLLTTHRENP
ncbi:MAG TPA: hypothetical protein VIF09_01585 [Polyangiaceae bacterium]